MLSVVMLMVGTLVTSYGVIHFMMPTITSPYYFASPENRWDTLFGSHLVSWLHISDPTTVRAFWESGRWGVPWAQFLRPLAAWLVFIVAAIWVMLCLMSLAARQWTDNERLTFPLVYLPLEIVRPEATQRGGFFRSPLMWAGVAIPVSLHTINGLHVYFPSVPALTFRHYNLGQFFQQRPWSAIGYLDVTFYPNLVGFTYLLTMEVAFSCWFFFLLRKLEPVLGAATGYSDTATAGGFTFPFIDQQATGAFLGVAVLGVWVGRRHFREIVRQALRDPRAGEEVAPMPYRAALAGAWAGRLPDPLGTGSGPQPLGGRGLLCPLFRVVRHPHPHPRRGGARRHHRPDDAPGDDVHGRRAWPLRRAEPHRAGNTALADHGPALAGERDARADG